MGSGNPKPFRMRRNGQKRKPAADRSAVSFFGLWLLDLLGCQREARSVAPEIFEAVVGALIFVEDMDDHVRVIGHDPLAEREAVDGHRCDAVLILEAVVQIACDRFQMRFGSAGTKDEEIREVRNSAQVDGDDVEGFFVGDDRGAEAGEGFRFDGMGPGKVDAGR